MDELTEIANSWPTDKGTKEPSHHGYTPLYDVLLRERRKEVRRVLEIGVGSGGSLVMWNNYFPHALVFGLDIQILDYPFLKWYPRINVLHADATRPESAELLNRLSPEGFDLIVDDGSHVHRDVVKSYGLFFPMLKKGGYYVVEDIDPLLQATEGFWMTRKR